MIEGKSGTEGASNVAGKYVTFHVDGEVYGIDLTSVVEIVGTAAVVPVAQGPAYVRGVLTGHGSAIPAVDLRLRFGRAPTPDTPHTCVIVARAATAQVGIIVDDVGEMECFSDGDLEAPPNNDQAGGYLVGLRRREGRETKILALDTVFEGMELSWLDEVRSAVARPPVGGIGSGEPLAPSSSRR